MIRPDAVLRSLAQTVVGQPEALEALVLGTIAGGHVLLEGPPGIAKTLACRTFAQLLGARFARIQFTPDLLPSDIVGTRIYNQREAAFQTVLGPVFAHVLLADEINRAPAKVQSALLEAMQERQVTIASQTHVLPDPFLVFGTMNSLDEEGTYALPEAQLDRFLLRARLTYPSRAQERTILERFIVARDAHASAVATLEDVRCWQSEAYGVDVDEKVRRYIVEIVAATRRELGVLHGASPRATLALAFVSRAKAMLSGRSSVLPSDVRHVASMVLEHRVGVSQYPDPGARGAAQIVRDILRNVASP